MLAVVLRQAVFQPRQLQQVFHQQLKTPEFLLQPLHQSRVVLLNGQFQPIAHQHQGGEGGLELMGHITHPAFLLLLLGFEGLTALDQHQPAFVTARQNNRLQRGPLLIPFTTLGTQLIAAAEDQLLQDRNVEDIPELHATNQAIGGDMKKAFGPVVDVGDGVVRGQDHPALGGRINPGQQLGSVQDDGAILGRSLRRSLGRQNAASTLQQKRDPDASCKAECGGDHHSTLSRSDTRSREPYGSTEAMRAPAQPFPAASGCEHPRFWCHR